jgi:hypothetical protein
MRARLPVALAVGAILLTSPEPASAKLPPWTCELSTTRPLVGQEVLVEVRFWNDPRHTHPARRVSLERLPDFVEVRAISRGGLGHALGVLHATIRPVEGASSRDPSSSRTRDRSESAGAAVAMTVAAIPRRVGRRPAPGPRALPARGHHLPVPRTRGGLSVLFVAFALVTALVVTGGLTRARGEAHRTQRVM